MKKPTVVLVGLPFGASAIFMNDALVYSRDSSYSPANDPADVAMNLAKAAGVTLRHVHLPLPEDPAWEWEGVYKMVPPEAPPAYLIDLSEHARQAVGEISGIRLAAGLGHTKSHSMTELLVAEVDGKKYALQISGYINGYDHANERDVDHSTLSEEQISELEKPLSEVNGERSVELESGPWFEWVDEQGSPVGDVFDVISLNPEHEVGNLNRLLLQDNLTAEQRFVRRVASLNTWGECEEPEQAPPSDGYEDSHNVLMMAIGEARKIEREMFAPAKKSPSMSV